MSQNQTAKKRCSSPTSTGLGSRCPIEHTMRTIGGKWKIPIIWQLTGETRRFGELKRLLPNITQKMLTTQLRELESAGVVNRHVFPVVPPHVEYSLTETGKTLKPIFNAMCKWGRNALDRG